MLDTAHVRYPLTEDDEDDETKYIEALCPIDRDIPGENGKPVPDISDRELQHHPDPNFSIQGS